MDGLFVPFNAKLGRPPKYTPNQLIKKFEEYLADREARPLTDTVRETGNTGQNKVTKNTVHTCPHPISIADFCVYLGVGENWFAQLTEDFSWVKTRIRTYIEDYQLKGAAAGVFNANIVARRLGLADKQAVDTTNTTRIVVESREQKQIIENLDKLGV